MAKKFREYRRADGSTSYLLTGKGMGTPYDGVGNGRFSVGTLNVHLMALRCGFEDRIIRPAGIA
jgi:hypothetical protein